MEDLAIGIDLGTTNSCAAYYINGRVKILENSNGGRITPSFIFFTNLNGTIVGEHAKRMANGKPEYGVYEIKRLVGRKFDDPYIQNNLQYFPFRIDNDCNNPIVAINHQNNILKKSPQELCTIILRKLKQDVEAKLGQLVSKAVITVPAYFNINQREVTLSAAKEAGFTVLKLLNEPTAAALSYYFENDNNTSTYSMVYDLGGGTFDVVVLKRTSTNIEIVCVDGDTHLGGHDFDNLIVDYVCDELMKNYNYNPKSAKENMRRLRNKCEDAKKALTDLDETVIMLNGFVDNHNSVQITLTRSQFETVAEGLFKKTILIVDSCLKGANIAKTGIQEVILSGGSTRIPKIQTMISAYFNGKTLNKFVNPDECVAEGAALQAAMLSNNTKQIINVIQMTDVTPLSLGISNFVGEMIYYIKKNTSIPVSYSNECETHTDQQTGMKFRIFEGERSNVEKNRLLGTMVISDITPAPPRQCHVVFTMAIDHNGILTVRAEERNRDNVKELHVKYARGNRSDSEVKNALKDVEDHRDEDGRFTEFARLKMYLIRYCIGVMYNLKKLGLTNIHKEIFDLCKITQRSAESAVVDGTGKMTENFDKIRQKCEPVVQFYNFEFMPSIGEGNN